MKGQKSIHKARLRFGNHNWTFELGEEPVRRRSIDHHHKVVSRVLIIHQRPSGKTEQVTFFSESLPAVISHLRRGLQEMREKEKANLRP